MCLQALGGDAAHLQERRLEPPGEDSSIENDEFYIKTMSFAFKMQDGTRDFNRSSTDIHPLPPNMDPPAEEHSDITGGGAAVKDWEKETVGKKYSATTQATYGCFHTGFGNIGNILAGYQVTCKHGQIGSKMVPVSCCAGITLVLARH